MNFNNFFNGQKLINRFFRQVDNVVWDLTTGKVGIVGNEGITSIEGEGEDAQVVINLFDQFGVPVPAFAQGTPTDSVKIGDLIYGARNVLGWVVEIKEKSFVVLKPDGTRSTWSPPKTALIGFGGDVMVLRSLMNILPNGSSGLANFQNMLLPLMFMGGDNADLEQIMPLMLMTQMGTNAPTGDGTDATNPLAGMQQMLPMLLMMNVLGKNKTNKNVAPGKNFFDNVMRG